MPEDVVARQQEKRRDQADDPKSSPHALTQRECIASCIVLHSQQDELLFADRLALFDEHVALGESVKMIAHPARASSRSFAVTSGSCVRVGWLSIRSATS